MHTKHANSRGVGGHVPTENFEKLHPLRLTLGVFLMIYDPKGIGTTEVKEAIYGYS